MCGAVTVMGSSQEKGGVELAAAGGPAGPANKQVH